MANRDTGNKQYSAQDIGRILNDLLSGDSGAFANTIFSRAREPYEYDNVAATADYTAKLNFSKYFDKIAQVPLLNRQKSLARATGMGDTFMSAIQNLMAFSPGAAMNVLQHHGGEQAVNTFLEAGSSIGFARGGRIGSVLNPSQLAENTKFAASQGALAYKNNFNKEDGTINIDQTHGINLPTAAYIATRTLSDRSQYDTWAERMKMKGPELSREEATMSSREIDNFRNGVGTTARAEQSFNKQIKQFTEQINRFVASVSKMTGDYESAIEFMQRATGEKLFSAGDEAAKARDNAARLAFGMRVAAVDAGIKPQAMAMLADKYSMIGASALGLDERSMIYNLSPTTARLGALAATGFAKWNQMNPYATETQKLRAGQAMEDRVDDYMRGDMRNMNVLSSYLIQTGRVNKSEVLDIVRSGDANKMFKYLANNFGGEARVRSFIDDKKNLEMYKMQYGDMVSELDAAAFAGGGLDQEKMTKGSRKIFDRLKKNLASELIKERSDRVTKIENDMGVSRKDILLTDNVLQESGITDPEKIAALKADVEKYNLSYDEALTRMGRYGGKSSKAKNLVNETFLAKASERYGADSEQVNLLKSPDTVSKIEKQINQVQRDAMLSKEALDAAGIKNEKRQAFLRDEALKGNWSADRIRTVVRDRELGDTAMLDLVASGKTVSKLEETLGKDSKAVDAFRKGNESLYGTESLGDLNRSAYAEVIAASKDREIQDIKSAILTEKDVGKREKLQGVLRSKISQGLRGENGYAVRDNDYLEILFSGALKNKDKMSKDEQKLAVSAAMASFNGALDAGVSTEAAFSRVMATKELKDKFDAEYLTGSGAIKNREQAYNKAKMGNILSSVTKAFLGDLGINLSDDDLKAKRVDVSRTFDQIKSKNPEATDDMAIAESLRSVFAENIGDKGTQADTLLNELSGRKAGVLTAAKNSADYKFMAPGLKSNRSSIEKLVEKSFSGKDVSNLDTAYELAAPMLQKERTNAILTELGTANFNYRGDNLNKFVVSASSRVSELRKSNPSLDEKTVITQALKDIGVISPQAPSLDAQSVETATRTVDGRARPASPEVRMQEVMSELGKSQLGIQDTAKLSDFTSSASKKALELMSKEKVSFTEAALQAAQTAAQAQGLAPQAPSLDAQSVETATRTVDGQFSTLIKEDIARRIKEKALSGSMKPVYGMSAGANSADAFYTSANEEIMRAPLQSAMSAMFGGNLGRIVVESMDQKAAVDNNKVPATYSGKQLERIKRVLDLPKKMEDLDTVKKKLTGSGLEFKNDKGEFVDLATSFSAFNEQYGSLNDRDYKEKLRLQYTDKGLSLLENFNKDSGISIRETVAAIGAGQGKTGEEARKAETSALVNKRVELGAPELSRDPEIAGYLSELVELTKKIVQKQGKFD